MATLTHARTLTTAAAVASNPASRTHTRTVPCVAHALSAGRATFGRGSQLLKAKRTAVGSSSRAGARLSVKASALDQFSDAEWKVIARAEIPALVPRGDFLDQLLKWSIIEFEENGRRGYGMKMVVDICEDYLNDNGEPTAYAIKLKTAEDYLELIVCMDNEIVTVEKNFEGFGVEKDTSVPDDNPFANNFEVVGRHLIIKRKQGELPEALRSVAANVVQSVSKSVATYYAFGSVYATDST